MTWGTAPLGSRQDSGSPLPPVTSWWPLRPRWPGEGGRTEMADVAYVLVFAGGFVLLAMVLRGLERL